MKFYKTKDTHVPKQDKNGYWYYKHLDGFLCQPYRNKDDCIVAIDFNIKYPIDYSLIQIFDIIEDVVVILTLL